jgi:dihydroxyacetone kinase
VSNIASIIEKAMDGTSGALYTIYLTALTHSLRQESSTSTSLSPSIWSAALSSASTALSKYTPAQPGDRTLIDALHPFIATLHETGDVKKAAQAAKKGAEGTKGMTASLGRAVYVGGEGFQKVPDPGAWGLAIFLGGLAEL